MALTGVEIRANLTKFAARWDGYEGSERSEAQTFLTELFAVYGVDRKAVGAEPEHYQQGGGYVDLLWPEVCLFEMKAPSETDRLQVHRPQALNYWHQAADSATGVQAPEYVVLCSFHRFEIWAPGRFPGAPRLDITLKELTDRYDALLFLAGDEPVFTTDHAAVTQEATSKVVELSQSLDERREGGPDERRDFILQSVWCMFAEDLGQIPAHRFTTIVDGLIQNPTRSSADELGRLFDLLANSPADRPRPPRGLYAETPYANGGLFRNPVALDLTPDELRLMREAASFDWHKIDPSIIGSLLEGALGHEKQWELGAHYTHEVDIQRIVEPTIVRPWMERIGNLSTLAEARAAERDLLNFVVLDPACGSGNFLYIAYRELRLVERALAQRVSQLAAAGGHPQVQGSLAAFFPITNIRGIEIDPFAVQLARVTLWMGHKQVVEELGLSEQTLPLADLSGVRQGDALALPWPRANAIIGNPPYHGSQNLRDLLGDERVEWLKRTFDCGVKDLCVYWFRRAVESMQAGDRAGLVGTNSVAQNRARDASLNYVAERGGRITDAISTQKWPGAAVVEVSIVNWIKEPVEPPHHFVLDGAEVEGINTRLRESLLVMEEYERLAVNAGRSFQGPIPVGNFYLSAEEAESLLARSDADYSKVVRPYLVGDDITDDPAQAPRRWIIDFGVRPLEEAMQYSAALDIVRERVKPGRDKTRRKARRERWWRFGESAVGMRAALAPLRRYVAANAQGKRFLFTWQAPAVLPSNLTNVFAFEDDYSMGVLTSAVHMAWANAEMSTLENRPRYTPTSCFETFPWPQPDAVGRDEIGRVCASLLERRGEICAREEIGLTELYNLVDEGAWQELGELHSQLDRAVTRAYGWEAALAAEPLELRVKLAERHRAISEGEVDYNPFGHLAKAGEG
ncbi:MAG: hypothetical protein M3350_04010 [Actinomycetota bacterium]|nr:hypothetical protein [Actinomycetota bacterium]